mgnify:CR=1 FL=1
MAERQQIQEEIDKLHDELDRALASGDEVWVESVNDDLDYYTNALDDVDEFDRQNQAVSDPRESN